ncbi:MAG: hypothetical protein J3K34DRAFT_108739 [Monoraphidium minutum]|nr:MAG: hypothetical protein J3K34DRAFT_108739 [Monoraphidium minutum]
MCWILRLGKQSPLAADQHAALQALRCASARPLLCCCCAPLLLRASTRACCERACPAWELDIEGSAPNIESTPARFLRWQHVHRMGFFGHRYSFCDDGAPCMGRAFSLLSAAAHALNARVTRMAGPDRWPWAGTWMTALGFRFASVLSVELELATDVQYAVRPGAHAPTPLPAAARPACAAVSADAGVAPST